MITIAAKIESLKKEIDKLVELRNEADSEWKMHSDEWIRHRNKAEEAEKRMLDLNDQIEYRLAEITELEEQANGQVPGAATAESA